MNVVEIKNVYKEYNKQSSNPIKALTDISFSVGPGEIVGLIGLNGCGKSSLLKAITGILKPDDGDISIFNLNPVKDRMKISANYGVVFGQRNPLWWELPVIDSLNYFSKMYKLNSQKYKENLGVLTELFELEPILQQPVRSLSFGQRMRSIIAASLLHDPKLLILDEPFIGLDVQISQKIIKMLKKLNNQRSTTILVSSHDLHVVEQLCQRVVVMRSGCIIEDCNLNQFVKKFEGYKKMIIECSSESGVHECLSRIEYETVKASDNTVHVIYPNNSNTEQALLQVISDLGNYDPMQVYIEKMTLNEVMKNVYI